MVGPNMGVVGAKLPLQSRQQHLFRYRVHVVGTVPERLRNIGEVSRLPSHHRSPLKGYAIGAHKLAPEGRLAMPAVEVAGL